MPRIRKFSPTNETIQEYAVCYARVSTIEQANLGVSLEAQEQKLKAYCLLNNLEIVKLIKEEGISGAKELSSRPGGIELLDIIKQKKAQHIVAIKIDRLFRDAANALNETKSWDKQGIALHIIDMNLNTATPMGRMFLTMSVGFAEMERNLIAERTATALDYKKSQLEVYSPVPFGYNKKEGKTENDPDLLIPNREEQRILQLIKKWRGEGWSLKKIADELTRKKIPTKQGRKWYASTVSYILKNNLYDLSK